MEPLLAAAGARIDDGGAPAVDGLDLATTGDRVLVLGAPRALFEAAAGLRPVTRGEARVVGLEPLAAVRAGRAAGAPLDPPVPPAWTLLAYVTWSARLAGHGRGAARARALEAVELAGVEGAARTRLQAAPLAVRRATVLAAALATGAEALLVEDPTPGLPDDLARLLARRVARALSGRRAVVFASRIALESPLALEADEALVVEGSAVVAQGAPAALATAERRVTLRVDGDVASFALAVTARGGRVSGTAIGPSARIEVDLGPLESRDLLALALAAHARVVELRPVSRALA